MANKRFKNWFFKTSQTALKKGTRLKNGDKPPQATFEDLVESTLFKTEIGDSAKEDTGTFSSDTTGHVSLATDAQAKSGYVKPAGRAIATQPSQLPTVDSNDQLIITSNNLPVAGETISISETSQTNNNYRIGLSDPIKNFFKSLVLFIDDMKLTADTLRNEYDVTKLAVTTLTTNSGNGNVLIGSIIPWLSNTIPTDYLLLNGQEVSKNTYSSLKTILGEGYGTPSVGTNFVLPDLRGRALRGLETGGPTLPQINSEGDKDYQAQILGQLYGADSVFLEVNNIPGHTHPAGSLTIDGTDGEHPHTWSNGQPMDDVSDTKVSDGSGGTRASRDGNPTDINSNSGQHTHTITGNTGENIVNTAKLNVTNPAILVNYIIRAL